MRTCCFCFPTVHKSWLYCLKTRLGLIICRRPPRVLSQIRPAGLHTFLHPVGILHHHHPPSLAASSSSIIIRRQFSCRKFSFASAIVSAISCCKFCDRTNRTVARVSRAKSKEHTECRAGGSRLPCPWHLKRPLRFLDRREGPQDTRGDRERAGRDLRHCPGRKPPFSMVKRGLVTFYNSN